MRHLSTHPHQNLFTTSVLLHGSSSSSHLPLKDLEFRRRGRALGKMRRRDRVGVVVIVVLGLLSLGFHGGVREKLHKSISKPLQHLLPHPGELSDQVSIYKGDAFPFTGASTPQPSPVPEEDDEDEAEESDEYGMVDDLEDEQKFWDEAEKGQHALHEDGALGRFVQAILEPADRNFQQLECPVPEGLARYESLKPNDTPPSTAGANAPHHKSEPHIRFFFALDLTTCVDLLPRLLGSILETLRFLGPRTAYCPLSREIRKMARGRCSRL